MPKRSNIFQRIVFSLQAALRPQGWSVDESVFLEERGSTTKREVDILAETNAFGQRVRVAFEVRGRVKRDDIEWVDALIGKYGRLDVARVVAVSASGFSATARTKAEAHGITLLTASTPELVDWPSEFTKLGIVAIARRDEISVTFTLAMADGETITEDARLVDRSGRELGRVSDALVPTRTFHSRRVDALLSERFLEYFKTLADLDKTLIVESSHPQDDLFVVDSQGHSHQVRAVTIKSASTFVRQQVALRHTLIDGHMVTSAELPRPGGETVEVFATQRRDAPGSATVRIAQASATPRRAAKKR